MQRVAAATLICLTVMATADKCESHTTPGQKLYSPVIGDVVLWASSFPSAEFAEVVYNVPIGGPDVGPLPVRGTWYKSFNGPDTGSMHVRSNSHTAVIECRVFRRVTLKGLKTGMQLVDNKVRDTAKDGPGSITCIANKDELPCKMKVPRITSYISACKD